MDVKILHSEGITSVEGLQYVEKILSIPDCRDQGLSEGFTNWIRDLIMFEQQDKRVCKKCGELVKLGRIKLCDSCSIPILWNKHALTKFTKAFFRGVFTLNDVWELFCMGLSKTRLCALYLYCALQLRKIEQARIGICLKILKMLPIQWDILETHVIPKIDLQSIPKFNIRYCQVKDGFLCVQTRNEGENNYNNACILENPVYRQGNGKVQYETVPRWTSEL